MSYPVFGAVERILEWMQQNPLALPDAFARVIEAEREKQQLSRAALAAKAGLHQTYVGLMERGKRSPNLATAQAIAHALGRSLSDLISKAEKLPVTQTSEGATQTGQPLAGHRRSACRPKQP